MHPLSGTGQWCKRNSHLCIATIWTVGVVYATLPLLNSAYTVEFDFEGATYRECIFDHGLSEGVLRLFTLLNFTLTFALPLVAISVSYVSIARKLAGDNSNRGAGSELKVVNFVSQNKSKSSSSGSKGKNSNRNVIQKIKINFF